MSNFETYMSRVLPLEGGYSNTPGDHGGETNWGITAALARSVGYTGAMADMTKPQALQIYASEFWQVPGFDKIDAIFPELAEYLLETGINLGPSMPSIFLQRALNAMSNQGILYGRLEVDGYCGVQTRAALTRFLQVRAADAGPQVLMGVMRGFAVGFYVADAERDLSQAKWEYGWLRNRALGIP